MLFSEIDVFVLAYEGESDDGGDGGQGGGSGDGNNGPKPGSGGGNDPGGSNNNSDSVTSQEHLNRVLKKEKEKFRSEKKELLGRLEKLQETAQFSEKERAELDKEIETLRTQTNTAEENARREKEKLEKQHQEELQKFQSESETWKNRYINMQIGNDIKNASLTEKVLPQSIQVMEALLRPTTHLVEVKDEEDNVIGFESKVKIQSKDKDNKPVMIEVSVQEAVKRMKEDVDQYGNLFEGTHKGGLGGSNAGKGKDFDPTKLSIEEYAKLRKENPSALGL